MSSHAIQPTWVPFHSTLSSEQKLLFSLRLMNGRFGAGVSLWCELLRCWCRAGSPGALRPCTVPCVEAGRH